MSVRPKHYRPSAPVEPPTMVAADLLKAEHPLNGAFLAWLEGKSPSKRQARSFLRQYPAYLAEEAA